MILSLYSRYVWQWWRTSIICLCIGGSARVLHRTEGRISERRNLEKRADDNEKIAVKRFETYEKNIKPVIDFYKDTGLLKVVNGEASITEINSEISALIEAI